MIVAQTTVMVFFMFFNDSCCCALVTSSHCCLYAASSSSNIHFAFIIVSLDLGTEHDWLRRRCAALSASTLPLSRWGPHHLAPGWCRQPLARSLVEYLSSPEHWELGYCWTTVQCCNWAGSFPLSLLVMCLKLNTKYTKLWRCKNECWCWWWQMK